MRLTEEFTNISEEAILEDSRIVKILRFCMLPVISQMKLGQFVGIASTADFEDDICKEKSTRYRTLKRIVGELAALFNEYLDKQRFLWLQTDLSESAKKLAVEYAKNWTCSLMANQNSGTAFRNWRKELQESTAVEQLVKAGYTSVPTRREISSIEDLLPGQFSRECRVKGINPQKADFVVRLKKSKKLLLIEAKAIGVKIDAFKRVKECREKFVDWIQAFGKNGCVDGAFVSGFIPVSECQSIRNDNAHIFWEHKDDLFNFVNGN